MDVLLTIGEFSKMTYLSVKALRHYHDVGLLVPADVDPATGYRRYRADQVPTAQLIRRFRDLDMPLDQVREVLGAPDLASRNRALLAHLERLQQQLERTRTSVAALQSLLTGDPHPPAPVELRRLPATAVVHARAVVDPDGCPSWLEASLAALHDELARRGQAVAGPDGALYADEFFEAGRGEVTAFVPVAGGADAELPSTTVAVLVHDGPFSELDRAYAALGTFVAERGLGGRGPIREHYLTPDTTEVCWPVSPSAA